MATPVTRRRSLRSATVTGFVTKPGVLAAAGTGTAATAGFVTDTGALSAAGVGTGSTTAAITRTAAVAAAGVGAATITPVVTLIERLIPDVILDMVGLSGLVSYVQDDPDSADANWLVGV
jgi:hypothetical protein